MTNSTGDVLNAERGTMNAEHDRSSSFTVHRSSFDVLKVRGEFPILQTPRLVYLDNAATSQKPRAVIDALGRYYQSQNANVHRAVHQLSETATTEYEAARRKVARFINAREDCEVIFTRGTTEAINLVAQSFGRASLNAGDEVVLSNLEHHSNIVPWQIVCQQTGARLQIIPIDDAGELLIDEYAKLLSDRTKLVAVTHVSNALGTINDVQRIARMAHEAGAKVLIDGAQHVAHAPTDVQAVGCDFYAFSGHKMYGPTGIGVLWASRALLEQMPPYQSGGDMIEAVSIEKTTYAQLPSKFEAGTPHIAGAIGLGAAIDYLLSVGFDAIALHEQELLAYATRVLQEIAGLRIVGPAAHKAGVISFVIDDPPIATLDIGTKLDAQGIAIRTGHHCCMPLMSRLGVAATARASLAMYNTKQEIDALATALRKIVADEKSRPRAAAPPASAGPDLQFPARSASSPQAAADELAETFDLLGDRDSRNQYVLELGEKLPSMPAALKTGQTRVHGCMSIVHLFSRRQPGGDDVIEFLADSDAHIVRGLIAILQKLYSGQRACDVLAFDIEGFLGRIGLDQFISSQRRNGLAGMVKRIRSDAATIAGGK